LAHVPPVHHDALCLDWRSVEAATRARLTPHRGAAQNSAWRLWETFCQRLALDPLLPDVPDKLPFLLLFAQRYRCGSLSPSRLTVRSRTVEDALRAVGQTFAGLGSPDPRLNLHGTTDIRLASLLRAWSRLDAPPARVRPIPVELIHSALDLAALDPALHAVGDCVALAFYFLLRPGEYSGCPKSRDDLFRIRDVELWALQVRVDPLTCPDSAFDALSFVSLTFSTQKNGVRGESTGHAPSGHPVFCPVRLLVRRLRSLRAAGALASTPLNAYRLCPTLPWSYVTAAQVTALLRAAASASPHLGLLPTQISARSTRSGGAMALLCGGVDADHIRLLGRWRSDAVFRYLHTQAPPLMAGLAPAMLRGGRFRLTPSFSHPSSASHAPSLPPLGPPGGTRILRIRKPRWNDQAASSRALQYRNHHQSTNPVPHRIAIYRTWHNHPTKT
jgi:hypothetical protein